MNNEASMKEELDYYIQKRKGKKFGKVLVKILENQKENLSEFYDFYGNIISENLEFALNHCYHYFRTKAAKIISAEQLMELDSVIMNNYVFDEIERLITSFKGVLEIPRATLTGHIFLSNFRFLGTGILNQKGGLMGPTSLLQLGAVLIQDRKNASMKKLMKKGLDQKFSENMLNIFQYHYPIIDAFDIKKGNVSVSYKVRFTWQENDMEKSKILKFKARPHREKNEPKSSYKQRLKTILNKIEETLMKSQTI